MKKLPLANKKLTIELDDATYKTLTEIATKRYEETPEELATDLLEWAVTGLAGTILAKWMDQDENNND